MNETDKTAEHFAPAGRGGVCFQAPSNSTANWLPRGYRLVDDPTHVIKPDDCVVAYLTNDWRLVRTINDGKRVGLCAADVGSDIHYVATLA